MTDTITIDGTAITLRPIAITSSVGRGASATSSARSAIRRRSIKGYRRASIPRMFPST